MGHIVVETSCGLSTCEVHEWLPWPFVNIQHPHSKHKDCLYGKWDHEGEKNVLLLWTWFLCWKAGGGMSSSCSVYYQQGQSEKLTHLHWGEVFHLILCCPIPIWYYFKWQRIRLKQHLMVIFSLIFHMWGAALILSSLLSVWWGFGAWKESNES